MPRIALLLVLLVTACAAPSAPAAAPATPVASSSPQSEVEAAPTATAPAATNAPTPPQPVPPVPMPTVTLKSAAFAATTAPVPQRVSAADVPSYVAQDFGTSLMDLLDRARGMSRANPSFKATVTDGEWDSRVWPGPFQKVARAAVSAKPGDGRFFHLDASRVDAAYALPWRAPDDTRSFQFVDITLEFRDHAEYPPAAGELWYTWHLRMPTTGVRVFAIADGYDGATAKTWMNPSVSTWSRSLLEQEATSAVAGYLWNESYVPGGMLQTAIQQTTPFWKKRTDALNKLNDLFTAKTLTERRFDNMSVRIDRFEGLTYFGGGIVTVTISGRLVEVLGGKTIIEEFTQPLKFFRFGNSGASISGWMAVDSQEDGVWLSGGDLALDKLQTSFG